MITSANRPKYLVEEYELAGPELLYITGDLSAAHSAVAAQVSIRDAAGARSEYWPSLDQHLTFMTLPHANPDALRDVTGNHPAQLLAGTHDYRELLVVADAEISSAVTFLLGRAVESARVQRTYFLGADEHLGALIGVSEIQVIDDPLSVYRWQHPDGPYLPVRTETLV